MSSMTIFKIILSIQKHGRSFHFFESSQFSFLIFYILSIKTFTSLGSVQFSHSVMSNSLWPHGLQHAGLPVHHQLPEFTQTHIHWVGDAIQSSHLLFSPSLLPSVLSSTRVFSNESVLHIRWPKYWSFSFSISPSNEGLSRVFSNTTVQKHQFLGTQLSLKSNSHIHTWPLEKP